MCPGFPSIPLGCYTQGKAVGCLRGSIISTKGRAPFLNGASRRAIAELAVRLQPHSAELSGRWRRRLPPGLSRAATPVVGRLLLDGGLPLLAARNFAAYAESVDYAARRLAKLGVPLHAIGEGLRAQAAAAEPLLAHYFPGRSREAAAALNHFQQAVYLRAVRAYDEVQRGALHALLGVLDAELEARNLHDLLERLLALAARAFAARWGGLLLATPDGGVEYAALYGVDRRLLLRDIRPGRFFRGMFSARQPGFILDAANDPAVAQPYFRTLEVKTIWAAPLLHGPLRRRAARGAGLAARAGQEEPPAFGILHVDFDRVYECLPQERALLLAFARRSSLAIERARLMESLAASHGRVRRLSRELLRAQENERRRISRDLHDAAGQVMMATRLHLEMARRQVAGGPAEAPIAQGLASVDAGIRELRRIIRDLTPLGLGGGLAAAVRRQAADFERAHGLPMRLRLRLPVRPPRELETLAFRWVQEGLTNIARHAHAHHVELAITAAAGQLQLHLADDGRGLGASSETAGFGLEAMRERVELAGGEFHLAATPGGGLTLEATIPWPESAALTEPPDPPAGMAMAAHA